MPVAMLFFFCIETCEEHVQPFYLGIKNLDIALSNSIKSYIV